MPNTSPILAAVIPSRFRYCPFALRALSYTMSPSRLMTPKMTMTVTAGMNRLVVPVLVPISASGCGKDVLPRRSCIVR